MQRNLSISTSNRMLNKEQSLLSQTCSIHQRVVIWWPCAFHRSDTSLPIVIISLGALPTAVATLKGAGSPAVLFISAVTTVIYEVTALSRTVAATVIAWQEACRTEAWKNSFGLLANEARWSGQLSVKSTFCKLQICRKFWIFEHGL